MDREALIKRNAIHGLETSMEISSGTVRLSKEHAIAILSLLKEQKGAILALEQANATINYLNEEKENAIKEIEKRKAFNLKCDGKPEWLRKGIDVGLNTALAIIKGIEERTE